MLLVISMAGATEISMAQWLPAFAERGLGYSKATGGMALAAFSLAMLVGRILVAIAGHHLNPVLLMVACCTASSLLYLIGCFFPSAPVALLACALVGLSGSCLWPTTLSLAANRFPNGGASMFGLMAAAGNGGCVVMPWLVGAIAEQSRIHYGLASVTFCPVVMVLLLLRIGSARG
jgi:fucose permease